MRYVATKAGPWRVNHDASGKVVVRRVDRDQTEVVIAVATWQDTVTVGRVQTKATVPSDAGWTDIDRAIAVALAAAADMPPDPRLDPGELPPRKPGEKVDGEAKEPVKPMGYFGLAILVLVLGGLAFGLYQTRLLAVDRRRQRRWRERRGVYPGQRLSLGQLRQKSTRCQVTGVRAQRAQARRALHVRLGVQQRELRASRL
jgi:hypothetical protein